MPSTLFRRFWRLKDYPSEKEILELLPFADDIQDGKVTQGVYVVHHPVWMIYLLAALAILVIILVGVIWPRTDRVFELLTNFNVVVFFYVSTILASWTWAKHRAERFMAQH